MSLTASTTMTPLANPTMDPTAATFTGDPADDPTLDNIRIPFRLLMWTHLLALFLVTLFVGLRIYVRRYLVRRIAVDDFVLIAAYVSFVIYVAFDLAFGINIQIHGLEPQFWTTFKLLSFWELPFLLCTVLVRGAIATFFLRALPVVNYQYQRLAIVVIFWLYALYMTVYTFVALFQCGSPADYSFTDNHSCLDLRAMSILPVVARVTTMILDWLMTLIPVIVVIRNHLSQRRKVSVILLMALAGGGSTISILRIVYNGLGVYNGPDDVPHLILYFIMALWENATALIVVSLAACRPLFEMARDHMKTSVLVGQSRQTKDQSLSFGQDIKRHQHNIAFIVESDLK